MAGGYSNFEFFDFETEKIPKLELLGVDPAHFPAK
jgi:hypothetical protein